MYVFNNVTEPIFGSTTPEDFNVIQNRVFKYEWRHIINGTEPIHNYNLSI